MVGTLWYPKLAPQWILKTRGDHFNLTRGAVHLGRAVLGITRPPA
jgi:hypothetical protein